MSVLLRQDCLSYLEIGEILHCHPIMVEGKVQNDAASAMKYPATRGGAAGGLKPMDSGFRQNDEKDWN